MAKSKQSAVERAKARLKKMNERGKGGGDFPFNYLNLADPKSVGEVTKTVVRIFPHWSGENDEEFYRERQIHRSVGKEGKAMVCPGKGCYVCKIMEERRKKGLAMQKENKEKGQKFLKAQVDPLKPKPRFFMNAVRLTKEGPVQTGDKNPNDGKPAEKPEVFGPGAQIMSQILALFVEDEAEVCGKFWDKKNRYDFLIKKEKTGKQDFNVEYKVMPTKNYVKVDTDELLEKMHDLDKVLEPDPTPEETKARFLNEEVEEPDEDEEDDDTDADDSDDEESDDDEPKKKKGKKSKDDDEDEADEDDDSDDDSDDEESSDDDDSDDDESDDDDDSDDEDSDDEADEDDDEDEKPAKKKGKGKSKKDDDEEEDDDNNEDEDDDEEDSDDDEDDDDADDDEDSDDDEESDDEDDDSDDEDDDEDSDDDDADEDDDDEDEKPAKKGKAKAKGKKEVSPKASPKGEKGKPEQPICFGDPDDHNPKDDACKQCPFNAKCAATKPVSAKVYGVKGGGAKFGQKKKAA